MFVRFVSEEAGRRVDLGGRLAGLADGLVGWLVGWLAESGRVGGGGLGHKP